MLQTYIKIAWRNLTKNKTFSLINIIGLSIGMAGAILILTWIQHEVGFDRFHKKGDRLYEVYKQTNINGNIQTTASTPEPMGQALKTEFAEVEASSRYNSANFTLQIGNSPVACQAMFIDQDFFSMFSFPFITGNPKSSFQQPNSVVLTQSAAKKFFGNGQAIGKTFLLNSEKNVIVTVTGILADFPVNTRFSGDALLNWSTYETLGYKDASPHPWTNGMVKTFVLLKPKMDLDAFNVKIKNIAHKKDARTSSEMFLYPSSQWHLYGTFENGKVSGGRVDRVYMFGTIAAFILLIACINFMNLSTARSEKRAREVGVRKVAGASRGILAGQFIIESVVLAFIAGIIALMLVSLLLKSFENMLGQVLQVPYSEPWLWLSVLVFILLTGIMAGSYPAFFLSSIKPIGVLKGSYVDSHRGINLRKALVVLQFTFAIGLIACTVIVRQQIKYAENRDTGYQKDQLVSIPLNDIPDNKIEIIRQEILNTGAAVSITKTMFPMTYSYNSSSGINWEQKDPNAEIRLNRYSVDADWVKTTCVRLIEGRDIDIHKFPADSTAVLLNEAAVKAMGITNPIGKKVEDNNISWTVVGVVKNFVFNSPYDEVLPMIVEGPKSQMNMITLRLNGNRKASENINQIESIFKKESPENIFTYQFADDGYAAQFGEEKRTAMLSVVFSTLAIIISCLGLLGLATCMVEQRSKEIGIRKVLGASIRNIVVLISTDFVKLVAIAFLLAAPLAYYIMNRWLQGFALRVNISLWVFISAGIAAMTIALFTVCTQAIKAALTNPVISLKSE